MEGVVDDGHVPQKSCTAVEMVDDNEDGGDLVGKSNPNYGGRHTIIHRQWRKRTVITQTNHAGDDVLEEVV